MLDTKKIQRLKTADDYKTKSIQYLKRKIRDDTQEVKYPNGGVEKSDVNNKVGRRK